MRFALALIGLAFAASATAQEPPVGARPPRDTVVQDTVPTDTLLAPPTPVGPAPRLSLTAHVGTFGIGDLQQQPVLAVRRTPGGVVTASDTLQRVIRVGGGFQVGASAVWSIDPTWAVRLGLSWGRSSLEASYSDGDDALRADVAAIAGPGEVDARVLTLESALRFRIPSQRRVEPYAEMGVGAVRWSVEGEGFPGAEHPDAETRPAVLAAVGVRLPLRAGLSGHFAISGRWFRTPLGTALAGTPVGEGDTVEVRFAAPGALPFADSALELTRGFRLEAGFSLELGRVIPRPRDRPESAASPTAPPR